MPMVELLRLIGLTFLKQTKDMNLIIAEGNVSVNHVAGVGSIES